MAMSQIATVILSGYVAMEPKLWFTKQGAHPVVHLRIGTTPRRVDPLTGEWHDIGTSFFTVNCWRKLALNVHASLHKGDPVVIRGRLKTRSWVDDGKNRTLVEIDADSIGHDLTYGWSHYLKGLPPGMQALLDPPASADPVVLAGISADGGFPASDIQGFSPSSDEPGGDRPPDEDDDADPENSHRRPAGEDADAAEPLGELVSDEVPF